MSLGTLYPQPMQQPSLVLFDLMGTLLHYREGSRPYWHPLGELVESAGILAGGEFNERYAALRDRRGPYGPREMTLRERLKQVAPPLSSRDHVLDHLIDTYMSEYGSRTERCEGVEEMLYAWAQAVPTGVVSNFFVANFPKRLLDQHGLSQYFGFILDSAQVGYRKPAREIYMAALELARMGEDQASQVIFVGDDWVADIEGPRRLGMAALLYANQPPKGEDAPTVQSWDEFRPPMALSSSVQNAR